MSIGERGMRKITKEEAAELLPGGYVFFGTNARIISTRARQELGLKFAEQPLQADIPRALYEEACSFKELSLGRSKS